MPSLCLCRVSLGDAEDLLARVWLTLETYRMEAPAVAVASVSQQLVNIDLSFQRAAEAKIVLDVIRRRLRAAKAMLVYTERFQPPAKATLSRSTA